MAYTKTNWVNNTTPLNATNMNKIEEGIAANGTAIEDVKANYMPVSGGLFTSNIGIAGNLEILGNDTLKLSTDGSITFPSAGGKLNGISDSTGTSSTIAVSQKCLADNYLPLTGGTVSGAMTVVGGITTQKMTTDALSVTDASGKISVTGSKLNFGQNNGTITSTITGISDSTGTSSTVAVSQKCLNDNYLPLSGGTMTGNLKVNSGVYVKNNFYVCKDDVTPSVVSGMVYTEWDSSGFIFSVRKADDGVTISAENGGTVTFGCGAVKSRLTGISNSTGTSSTIAASQKCLSDNYIAKTSAAVSAAINLLPAGTSAPVDADYYVCQSVGGGTTDTTYYRRPMSYLWSYINGKLGNSYLPISGGTLTGTLTATKFTGDGSGLTSISAGQLTGTVDVARLPDLSGKYLPISGGTITGDTTIMGSGGQYGLRIINGDICFLDDGGSTILNRLSGIVSKKGTSPNHAMSQKGVADNYVAKSDISNTTGTDTTKVPSLKCLNDNYLPLSGGSVNGTLNAESLNVNETALLLGGANIQSNTDIYGHLKIKTDDGTEYLTLSQNSIQYSNTNTNTNWTFAGTIFSTTDLTAGTSALPDNQLYFVYE